MSDRLSFVSYSDWTRGVLGGFFGAIPFGFIMLYAMNAPVLEMIIPAMYGVEGPALVIGWLLHLFHGTILGIGYVTFFETTEFVHQDTLQSIGGGIRFGVLWGFMVMVLMVVLIMPIWLNIVGFAEAPPFPNVGSGTILSLLGHVIWAIILGMTYGGIPKRAIVNDVISDTPSRTVS